METTAIVLAGGLSSRMGTNKALLTFNGKTVIENIVERLKQLSDHVMIVTNTFADYEFLQIPMTEDKRKGMGPLAGIEAGLLASETERNLFVACDMPFISIDLGKYLLTCLEDYQAVVPEIAGQLHPLFAAYRKEALPTITESLVQNQLRIRSFLKKMNVKIVKEDTLEGMGLPHEEVFFYNMNNREEYQKALHILKNGNVIE